MSPGQRASSAGQSLQARIEQLNTLASAQTGDVQLVQTATVPTSPSFPNTKLNVAIGVVLGLLLGVGLMLLLERLNRRVRTVDELSEVMGYPVIAEVPETKRLRRNRELSRPTAMNTTRSRCSERVCATSRPSEFSRCS